MRFGEVPFRGQTGMFCSIRALLVMTDSDIVCPSLSRCAKGSLLEMCEKLLQNEARTGMA